MGFTIKPTEQLLRERGLQRGGKVQKFIDSECIRHMDKYTPMRTGHLKDNSIDKKAIGSGLIIYNAKYARNVYYNSAGHGKEGTANGGLRGRLWFERMKASCLKLILDGARKIARAKR